MRAVTSAGDFLAESTTKQMPKMPHVRRTPADTCPAVAILNFMIRTGVT
eukprot:SAG25_NODE_292_length_10289_cov_21.085770_11_plen_49_part_00